MKLAYIWVEPEINFFSKQKNKKKMVSISDPINENTQKYLSLIYFSCKKKNNIRKTIPNL